MLNQLNLTVSNECKIGPIPQLPGAVLDKIRQRFTFANPAYALALKHGRWTGHIEEFLSCCEIEEDGIYIPRGATRKAIEILKSNGVPFRIDDRRSGLPEVDFHFVGKLRPYQEESVIAMLRKDFGVLVAPTGSGKTTMALSIIAARRQPALIAVHTRELADQWIDRIGTFLGIPRDQVGLIGGGKRTIGKQITVGMVQTLVKCAGEVSHFVGHLVVDEAHHCPSRMFSEVVSAFDSKYMLGLSATPWRRDKLSRLIYWHLGDKQHEVDRASLVDQGHILKPEIIIRETGFSSPWSDPCEEYSQFIGDLVEDQMRNRLICGDIEREYRAGTTCLVLSDRVEHCRRLQAMLAHMEVDAVLLNGRLSKAARASVMHGIIQGHDRAILATSSLAGEGLDIPHLDALFLVTPVKFSGRLTQYIGRVLRPAPGKGKPKIYDYVDEELKWQSEARRKVYMGIAGEAA